MRVMGVCKSTEAERREVIVNMTTGMALGSHTSPSSWQEASGALRDTTEAVSLLPVTGSNGIISSVLSSSGYTTETT